MLRADGGVVGLHRSATTHDWGTPTCTHSCGVTDGAGEREGGQLPAFDRFRLSRKGRQDLKVMMRVLKQSRRMWCQREYAGSQEGVDTGNNREEEGELEDKVCLYLDVRAPPIKGVV